MKAVNFVGVLFTLALIFNLELFPDQSMIQRFGNMLLYPFSLILTGLFLSYVAWISSCYRAVCKMQNKIGINPSLAYLLIAVIPILIFHLGGIWCLVEVTENASRPVLYYRSYQFALFLIVVFGYGLLVWFKPKYAWAPIQRHDITQSLPVNLQQVNQTPDLITTKPIPLDLEVFYVQHIQAVGLKQSFPDLLVRFIDVVFIRCESKRRFVVLANGEKVLTSDDIIHDLEKRGWGQWMLRISKNYYINMMLVVYPNASNTDSLTLQPVVCQNMQLRLTLTEIDQMCKIGQGIKRKKPVEGFLANKDRLESEGWDDLFSL